MRSGRSTRFRGAGRDQQETASRQRSGNWPRWVSAISAKTTCRRRCRRSQTLADLPLMWHFIGQIQANKTRLVAEHFHWVHTLDRERSLCDSTSNAPRIWRLLMCASRCVSKTSPAKAESSKQARAAGAHTPGIAATATARTDGICRRPAKAIEAQRHCSIELAACCGICASKDSIWTRCRWACRAIWRRPCRGRRWSDRYGHFWGTKAEAQLPS